MADRRKQRNQFEFLTKKFPKRMKTKLVLLFIAVILAFLVLIIRITYINATKGNVYTQTVLDQQQYDSRVIPYKRGDITDRNGTKIATSERVYNVILDVYVMLSDEDYEEPTKQVLEGCFGISGAAVDKAIEEDPESRYTILARNVSYEKAQEFQAIDENEEDYPNVKGIWLEDNYLRSYPYNSLACDVIGFSGSGNVGAIGIESAYNDILNGTDGREYGYFSDDSTVERTVKAAKNGNTVVSTIDVTLQSIVEQCIAEFNEAHAGEEREGEAGSRNTGVIIMDPNTGEILAEASYPVFDLNNPEQMSYISTEEQTSEKLQSGEEVVYSSYKWMEYTEERWNALSDEEKSAAQNALWRNFCVSDAYEPGSTIKPFTVASGLETGALTGDETYVCSGSLHVGDWDIACHLHSGHGTETVADAVANSCNVALMQMAEAIGKEDFIRYQHQFGFGEYTGIDLPGESAGLTYSADTMGEAELATASFGQGFNVTMTQMMAGFSSLINGGYYYEPHVVKQIQDENGNVIETKDPTLLRKTVSEETSRKVREYMKAVMEYGTGKNASVPGYDIGGKTGTAEKLPRGNNFYVLSYIGYAPQENPEVAIYVVIDSPNVPDQDNSAYVLELAQKIMSQAFPYLGVSMIEGYEPEETQESTETTDVADTYDEYTYTDFDAYYEDPYSGIDGAYVDDTYTPDFDDWATGDTVE